MGVWWACSAWAMPSDLSVFYLEIHQESTRTASTRYGCSHQSQQSIPKQRPAGPNIETCGKERNATAEKQGRATWGRKGGSKSGTADPYLELAVDDGVGSGLLAV